MSSDADLAYIARQRWRAQLHRLNGDENGAVEKEQEADLLERYHTARDAALALKADADEDAYYESSEQIVYAKLRQDVRDFRFRQRSGRDIDPTAAGQATLAMMHDFAEPSDDELLGGVS